VKLGCVGITYLVTSPGRNIICWMCCLSLRLQCYVAMHWLSLSPWLEQGVASTTVKCFEKHICGQLCAAMGEPNDLANDAREGPFRTRWIRLLGTLSKKAISEREQVINGFFLFCNS